MSTARIALLASAVALVPGWARAQYRHPSTCQDGCMTVSAYRDHGGRTDWNCGGITYGGHPGTDFAPYGGWAAVDEGRAVVAAAEGTVVYAHDGEFDRCTSGSCAGGGGFGNYVAIQHADGVITWYGHQRTGSIAVSVGQWVVCGQHLGFIASSGSSTGPHLHFEPRAGGGGFEPFGYGGCSDPVSRWVDQRAYASLPGTACPGPACDDHCEGSVVVGSDCGRGDCGVFGSRCVDDALGARCASWACPDLGDATVCIDGNIIGNCHDGAISTGDCSAFGSRCTAEGGPARCAFFACPSVGETTVCIDDHIIGTCRDGAIETGDCSVYGAFCSSAGATPGHCASVFCAASATDVITPHDTCLPDGRLVHCTDLGGLEDAHDCPAGTTCTEAGGSAACVDPTAALDAGVDPAIDDAGADDAGAGDAAMDPVGDGSVSRADAVVGADAGIRASRPIASCGCSTSTDGTSVSGLATMMIALGALARRRGRLRSRSTQSD